MKSRGVFAHPVAVARRATRRRAAGNDEAGFTLIELVIVVVILPIVIGGIAAALLSVFGLQDQTQNRVGDSNDEQVSSSTFNKDVQSAQQIETATTPACGTSGQTQLVGLEWALDANGNYDTVVSYVVTQSGTANWLVRQICTTGASATPTSSRVVSHDAGTPTVTFNPSGFIAPNTTWKSTQGLYGVTLNISEPGERLYLSHSAGSRARPHRRARCHRSSSPRTRPDATWPARAAGPTRRFSASPTSPASKTQTAPRARAALVNK